MKRKAKSMNSTVLSQDSIVAGPPAIISNSAQMESIPLLCPVPTPHIKFPDDELRAERNRSWALAIDNGRLREWLQIACDSIEELDPKSKTAKLIREQLS